MRNKVKEKTVDAGDEHLSDLLRCGEAMIKFYLSCESAIGYLSLRQISTTRHLGRSRGMNKGLDSRSVCATSESESMYICMGYV